MATRAITGVIKRVAESICSNFGSNQFDCEFIILADTGEFLPVRYRFESLGMAETVRDSLDAGTPVEVSLDEDSGYFFVRALKIMSAADKLLQKGTD